MTETVRDIIHYTYYLRNNDLCLKPNGVGPMDHAALYSEWLNDLYYLATGEKADGKLLSLFDARVNINDA